MVYQLYDTVATSLSIKFQRIHSDHYEIVFYKFMWYKLYFHCFESESPVLITSMRFLCMPIAIAREFIANKLILGRWTVCHTSDSCVPSQARPSTTVQNESSKIPTLHDDSLVSTFDLGAIKMCSRVLGELADFIAWSEYCFSAFESCTSIYHGNFHRVNASAIRDFRMHIAHASARTASVKIMIVCGM